MRPWFPLALAAAASLVGCALRNADPTRPSATTGNWPGPQSNGIVRLPNQWALDPVGRHVPLADFPVNVALHPSGRLAAVLHCGFGTHEVVLVDLRTAKVTSRVPLSEAFVGVAFSNDGKHLYASGAGKEVVHAFDVSDALLSNARAFTLRPLKERGVAAGLALAPDGSRLWVANVLGQSVSELSLDATKGTATVAREFVLGTPVAATSDAESDPDKGLDEESITKRARALLDTLGGDSPYPYTCAVDLRRQRLYVSLWGQSSVAVIDLATGTSAQRWAVQDHPNEMLLTKSGDTLYVANANQNTVSVLDTQSGKVLETLVAELSPDSPPGSTPNGLALSPDESLLFVSNANINAVAVFDVRSRGRSHSMGFIPVGWYPTAVRVTPDGKHLLVVNGKGMASKSNRLGPQPGREAPATVREYIGGLMQGSLSIIDLPKDREDLAEKLRGYNERALRCRPPAPPKDIAANHPIPRVLGQPSPIRYCIYVIKENRTYDQVLGDLPGGRGDPSLCLFPEPVTPNHHRLARDFVLLDNFYVESEVSADGHEWTVGAYATDFVERFWPMSYGHNQDRKYTYPSEGRFPIAAPAGGYLWDRAKAAGVTYRSYGEFVNNGKTTNDPCTTRIRSLQGHFDPGFRSFDMDYSDLARADRFISELRRFEREGGMPRLQIVRLPNDHTAGTSKGKPTPTAYMAENDLALGRLVEAVSQSKFWAQTAIFVVEDDAQNGPDHIDAHRTVAYVLSPYTRRAVVDSSLYSTCSMLRTMELILGMKPMTQFDAAALPMFAAFSTTPDLRPYKALVPSVRLDEKNLATAWGSDASSKMDLTREDAADDLQLNEVIWRSVKGRDVAMPAPVRAGFVLPAKDDDDDD